MMKNTYDLSKEKIIVLIFILTLSSCSFFTLILLPTLNQIIKQVLFYFSFFGFGFITMTILTYYLSKANEWLNKDKGRLIVFIAMILALVHALFIGLDNKSWFSFFGYLAGDGLIILTITLAYKRWGKKNGNSNIN